MSDLNRELSEYLSRNETKTEDKEPLLPTIIQDLKFTKVKSWFSKSKDNPDETASSGSTSSSSSGSWFNLQQNDNGICSLGRKQRLFGFFSCLTMGIICYSLALMYIPFLLLKARKFALLFTLGSIFSLLSFSFLWGPMVHLRHLFSKEKLIFTSAYLGSLVATLFFAMSLQSTILTVIAALVQAYALVGFLLTTLPGGSAGVKFFYGTCTSLCKGTVSKVLPV